MNKTLMYRLGKTKIILPHLDIPLFLDSGKLNLSHINFKLFKKSLLKIQTNLGMDHLLIE